MTSLIKHLCFLRRLLVLYCIMASRIVANPSWYLALGLSVSTLMLINVFDSNFEIAHLWQNCSGPGISDRGYGWTDEYCLEILCLHIPFSSDNDWQWYRRYILSVGSRVVVAAVVISGGACVVTEGRWHRGNVGSLLYFQSWRDKAFVKLIIAVITQLFSSLMSNAY